MSPQLQAQVWQRLTKITTHGLIHRSPAKARGTSKAASTSAKKPAPKPKAEPKAKGSAKPASKAAAKPRPAKRKTGVLHNACKIVGQGVGTSCLVVCVL